MNTDTTREQSEFNMAVSYLNRLNYLCYSANESAMGLDAPGWSNSLLCLFRAMHKSMTDEEKDCWEKKRQRINNLINLNNRKIGETGLQQIGHELYEELHNFEMFLIHVLEVSGLQKKMKEDFLAPEREW